MMNQLLRSNLDLYGGYEISADKTGFFLAFNNPEAALNYCIATQIGLMRVKWPADLLSTQLYFIIPQVLLLLCLTYYFL